MVDEDGYWCVIFLFIRAAPVGETSFCWKSNNMYWLFVKNTEIFRFGMTFFF